MRTLTIILILLSFIQTSVIPINFVLLILIARGFLKTERDNLILAFFLGLFLSFLNHSTLGLYSLIMLVLVEITHSLSQSPISKNFLILVPLTLVSLCLFDKSFSFGLILQSLLILPIYIVIRLLDERFMDKNQIKLKI